MQLAIITINWNSNQRTFDTLNLIRHWGRKDILVIIVDNGSEPESVLEIKNNLAKNHYLIELAHNKGFSGACNEGIRKALENNIENIFLLNTDATLTATDITKLEVALAQDATIAAIGPLILDSNGTKILNAGGRNIAWYYHTNSAQARDLENVYDVDYVSGTAVMIKSEVLRESGLFCESYFFSGEVADWCTTIKKRVDLPNRVVIDPRASALHKPEMASSLRGTLYTYYTVRNRYLYIRRHHKLLSPLLVPLWVIRHFRHWLAARKEGARVEAGMVWRGVRDGLLGRWGRIDQRWEKLCT
ncbi:MAG TPA: glycosyltransferase family 2 protein [Gammaproteobacteria bacterium]|nr:glycosyltransferase family 2 protein [Gammaproteobacteria bacterium]